MSARLATRKKEIGAEDRDDIQTFFDFSIAVTLDSEVLGENGFERFESCRDIDGAGTILPGESVQFLLFGSENAHPFGFDDGADDLLSSGSRGSAGALYPGGPHCR